MQPRQQQLQQQQATAGPACPQPHPTPTRAPRQAVGERHAVLRHGARAVGGHARHAHARRLGGRQVDSVKAGAAHCCRRGTGWVGTVGEGQGAMHAGVRWAATEKPNRQDGARARPTRHAELLRSLAMKRTPPAASTSTAAASQKSFTNRQTASQPCASSAVVLSRRASMNCDRAGGRAQSAGQGGTQSRECREAGK